MIYITWLYYFWHHLPNQGPQMATLILRRLSKASGSPKSITSSFCQNKPLIGEGGAKKEESNWGQHFGPVSRWHWGPGDRDGEHGVVAAWLGVLEKVSPYPELCCSRHLLCAGYSVGQSAYRFQCKLWLDCPSLTLLQKNNWWDELLISSHIDSMLQSCYFYSD